MTRSARRKSNGFDLLSFIQSFFLLLYCAELVCPFITSFGGSNYLSLVCFLAWFAIAIIRKPQFVNRLLPSYVVLIVTYVLTSVLPYIYGHTDIAHRYIALTAVFFGAFIFKYYKEANELRILGKILAVTMALSLVTTVTTLRALLTDSWASRSLGGTTAADMASYRKNIGGYHFIYYLVGLSLIFLYFFFIAKKSTYRIGSLFAFLLTGFTIAKSNFMTALVVWTFGTIYLIIAMSANSKNRVLKGMFAVALLAIALIFFDKIVLLLPPRIAKVVSSGDSSALSSIWNELMSDRWPVMMMSVEAACQYPLFGIMASNAMSFDGTFLTGFGQHSFFLDGMALYGFPLGIAIMVALIRVCKFQRKNGIASKLGKVAMLYMVIMLLFNNVTNSIGLVSFVICPYVQEMVSRRVKYGVTSNYRKVPAQLRQAR